MRRLLSNHNHKLGRLSSFALPLSTCDKTQNKQCRKYCYARYLFKIYSKYRAKMTYNYRISKSDRFVKLMNEELKEASLSVRIHVSGDFYSQKYLNKWLQIARMNPRQIFYCYTKSINLDFGKRPRNFIVYLSDDQRVLQKEYKRFDGVAAISFDKKPIRGFRLCRHQADSIHCAHCELCMHKGNRIYFDLH